MYKNVYIIIPNYNNADFIDQSIQSVINQSFKNWKIYIVDDHNKGPVYSVLKLKGLDENEPIIISYCDFFVKWD